MATSEWPVTADNVTQSPVTPSADFGIPPSWVKPTFIIGFGVMGFFTNGFVLIVVVRHKPLRQKISQHLIIHQTVIDFLSSLITIVTFSSITAMPVLYGTGGDVACDLILNECILWVIYNTSTFNLVVLTLERYLMVVFPIAHRKYVTKRLSRIAMAITWIFSASYNMPFSILTTAVVDGSCWMMSFWSSETLMFAFGLWNVIIAYMLPVVILLYCYGHMIYILVKKSNKVAAHKPPPTVTSTGKAENADAKSSMSRAQMNVTKIMIVVTVAFIVCWTPIQIHFTLYNFAYPKFNFFDNMYVAVSIISAVNLFINPFIYIAKYDEFKVGARSLVGLREKKENSSDGQSTATGYM